MNPIYIHSRKPDRDARDTPGSQTLTLGSLFDGSGGFPLGGLLCGITPVWASEIEPFPIRVTTKRLPFMKHYGDVSRMDGGKIEPVDVITFGSPCQDMSIAGKRAGLDGSRSNLFYEAIRIVREMRCATDEKYPRYIVWENVPGAFSSNKGADFQSVLEEICSVKGHEIHTPRPEKWPATGEIVADDFSLAWRVFDAQYWGVPQRRKRIYFVADFAGGSAGKILFESEGVSGYTPQGFRPWQGVAGAFAEGAGASGCVCLVRRLTPTECARMQGFPDWWCAELGTDEPTEDEIEFWTEVFEAHRSAMGKSSRPKSRNQIIKWLKNPHSDSAEYKMWGNGVALPNVYFVLSGIVYYARFSEG